MKNKFFLLILFFVLAGAISFFVINTNKKEAKTVIHNYSADLPNVVNHKNIDRYVYADLDLISLELNNDKTFKDTSLLEEEDKESINLTEKELKDQQYLDSVSLAKEKITKEEKVIKEVVILMSLLIILAVVVFSVVFCCVRFIK
jgi:hypothetical protein